VIQPSRTPLFYVKPMQLANINNNSNEVVTFSIHNGVAIISINKPDELNTFTGEVIDGLLQLFQRWPLKMIYKLLC
jgi:1,4-dihydroxy-2-naphthoyl-CoA synthase